MSAATISVKGLSVSYDKKRVLDKMAAKFKMAAITDTKLLPDG